MRESAPDLLESMLQSLNSNLGVIAATAAILPPVISAAVYILQRVIVSPKIRTTVSVDNYVMGPSTTDPELRLSYRLDDESSIEKTLPYLSRVERKDRIGPNHYFYSPFDISLPILRLDIVNSSDTPILVKSFSFHAKMSSGISKPIPFFNTSSAPLVLEFSNEGSAPMKDVRISAQVSTSEHPEDKPLSINFEADEIQDFAQFSIAEHLRSEGVNTQYLLDEAGRDFFVARAPDSLRGDDRTQEEVIDEFRTRVSVALGPYGSLEGIFLYLHGKVSYRHRDERFTIPFTTRTLILQKAFAPPPPTAEYDIEFRTDGANYTVEALDIQTLNPKEAHRFSFRLFARGWSRHEFSVRVLTDQGSKTIVKSMKAELFQPRTNPIFINELIEEHRATINQDESTDLR